MAKAVNISAQESSSGLLNARLADWIAQHGRKELEARLAADYRDSDTEARQVARDFAAVDAEGWSCRP